MRKYLKNNKRFAIVLLIIVVQTVLMPFYIDLDFTTAYKQEIKTEDITSVDSSTFVVLEIVPDKAYANFGYNVGGQEPVNLQKVIDAGKASDLINNFTIDGKQKVFTLLVEYSSIQNPGFVENTNTTNKTSITFSSGYYKKVAEGTGEFVLSADQFEAKESGNYIFVEAANNEGTATNQFQNNQVWVENETIAVSQVMYKKEMIVNNDYFKKISLDNPDAKVLVETVTPALLNTNLSNNSNYLDNVDMIVISDNKMNQTNVVNLWNTYAKPSGESLHNMGIKFSGVTDLTWNTTIRLFKRVIGIGCESIPIVYDSSALVTATKNWTRNTDKLYFMLKKMNPIVFYNLYLNDNTSGGGALQVTKINNQGVFNNGVWQSDVWNEDGFKPLDTELRSAYGFKFDQLTSNLGIQVQDNVYCYNGDSGSVQFLDKSANDTSVTKTALTEDFFNYILNNKGEFDVNGSSTSPAYVLKYIIGYAAKSRTDSKSMVNVLDIEPCNSFTKSIEDFRKMMPTCSASIKITKQTSSAFNGKIENLNEAYKLIYLGLNYLDSANTSKWYTLDSNKLPVYNDGSLNGKIYLHVGDKVIGPTSNERYWCWSYSGWYEDWAQDAVDWLKGDTTANNEVRWPGNDITKRKAEELKEFIKAGYPIVVNSTLYNASSVNATFKAETKKKVDCTSNIFKFIESNNAENLISENEINKSSITRTEKYISVIKPSINMISAPKKYVGTENDVLNNPSSLYVNGDNTSNRTLTFKYEITDNASTDNAIYSVMLYADKNMDGRFSEGEKIRKRDNLSKGVYTLSIALGEDYLGAITWRLVVVNNNNPCIRDEKTGTCAICNSIGVKKVVRILQVTNDGSNLNMDTNPSFINYTKNLRDYSLKITVLKKADFEAKFVTNPFKWWEPETTDQLVNTYDMIIFGFRDAYDALDPGGTAIKNVTYFMQQGKSVLFTHDVTSLANTILPVERYLYGYAFNKHLRGYLGLDRFGARVGNGDISGLKANDTATIPNLSGTYHAIHGYSVWAIRRLGGRKAYLNKVPLYPDYTYDDNTNGEGLGLTTKVNKTNVGQVTQYPYLIQDEFTVGKTHAQSYQLDMEDPNVVVWYTLADDGYRPGGYKVPNPLGEIYSISPSDASNNYYLYSKGNITYSSVGHSPSSNEEIKLLVNTIIAAYKTSIQPPTINIENSDIIESSGKLYMYVDQSYSKSEFSNDKYLDIKFTPYVNSLLSENMTCLVSFEGMDGEAPIYNDTGDLVTTTVSNKTGKLVKSDCEYKIKYPLNLLNKPTNNEIAIKVENEKGIYETVTITLLRRTLFDLD